MSVAVMCLAPSRAAALLGYVVGYPLLYAMIAHYCVGSWGPRRVLKVFGR